METQFFLLCVCLKTSVIKSKSRCAAEASTSFGCAGARVCGPCGSWCRARVWTVGREGHSLAVEAHGGRIWVAVNGSPATITIETCEDPSDWTTAIGGTGSSEWAPWGWGGGGCARRARGASWTKCQCRGGSCARAPIWTCVRWTLGPRQPSAPACGKKPAAPALWVLPAR